MARNSSCVLRARCEICSAACCCDDDDFGGDDDCDDTVAAIDDDFRIYVLLGALLSLPQSLVPVPPLPSGLLATALCYAL